MAIACGPSATKLSSVNIALRYPSKTRLPAFNFVFYTYFRQDKYLDPHIAGLTAVLQLDASDSGDQERYKR